MKHFITLIFLVSVLFVAAQPSADPEKSPAAKAQVSKPKILDVPVENLPAVTVEQLVQIDNELKQLDVEVKSRQNEKLRILGILYNQKKDKPDSVQIQSYDFQPDKRRVVFKVVRDK